ncbi:hypothetical protein Tco_0446452 [Tanacetum coccineum]
MFRVDITEDMVIMQGVQVQLVMEEHRTERRNANPVQAIQVKCTTARGSSHSEDRLQPKRPQNSEYFKDKMLLMQAQENGVVLDEEQLLKHDEIARKNLLIEHDNIIVDDLSKEVFYVASNSELNVFRFTEMQKAHHVVKARCLELEAELSNLRYDVRKDNYNDLLNRNNREVHLVYLRHLKESVDTLREIVEEAKVERPLDGSLAFACRYTKHSQELLEYVFGTCPKVFHQQDKKHAHTPRKKQVTFEDQIATSSSNTHKHVEPMHTQKSNVPVPPSTGVNSCTDASRSQLRVIPQEHWIPRQLKVTIEKVVQIVLWYLDSGCSKHMTGDRSRLMNFVKKFIGTVGFGNDHFGAIIGYGDYVVGNSVISRKHSCYVRDTDGVELLKGSCGSNLYTISVEDMMKSSLICLLSKASKNKSWL